MRACIFIIICITGFLPWNTADPVYAMDSDGCLTCHQYPGLVRLIKPDSVKVLHIDEDAYRRSSHGDLRCRQCHLHINKIPHTGETSVNCETGCHHSGTMSSYETDAECSICHLDYKKRIRFMDIYLHTFHSNEQTAIMNIYSKSSCRVCHPLYSHSKNRRVRAYINLHAGFLVCEACHLRNNQRARFKICGNCHANGSNLAYDWGKSEAVVFSGRPFGKYRSNNGSLFGAIKNLGETISMKFRESVLLEEPPVKTPETAYSLSRISVFTNRAGSRKSLLNTWDTRKAAKFKSVMKFLRPSVRRQKLKYFHRDVAKLEISVLCNECHSPDSMLDTKRLGFDEIKSRNLKNLDIKGIATKYRTFYFPDLLHVN